MQQQRCETRGAGGPQVLQCRAAGGQGLAPQPGGQLLIPGDAISASAFVSSRTEREIELSI